MIYTLIEKNLFDVLQQAIKNNIIGASNSETLGDVPIYSLSGNDFYLFESDKQSYLQSYLSDFEAISLVRLSCILSSGAYTAS